MEIVRPDFGSWLGATLKANGLKLSDLVRKSGQHYSDLNRLIHSGEKGRPIRPDPEKISVIVESLADLGVGVDLADALAVAGYRVAAKAALASRCGGEGPKQSAGLLSEEAIYSTYPEFVPIFDLLLNAKENGALTADILAEIERDVKKSLDAARYRQLAGAQQVRTPTGQ